MPYLSAGVRRSRRAFVLAFLVLGGCSVTETLVDPDAEDPSLARKGEPVASVTITPPIELAPPSTSASVGSSLQFSARTFDSRGRNLPNRDVAWSVSTAASVATIDASGLLRSSSAGKVTVTATSEGQSSTYAFDLVGAATAPTPAPAPVSPSVIPATIRRFDGGSGTTVVSSGVPLVPGALFPGQEAMLRVTVGGVERPAYVAGLKSRHPDGSLRTVLVQLQASVATGTDLEARVDLGTQRSAAMTIAAPLAAPAALPSAALLPTSADYLVLTDLVGATKTRAVTATFGGDYLRYDNDFATAADQLWASEGAKWEGNYYDRALIYYAMWVRTANPEYWWRGTRIATGYRQQYLEPNNLMSSPHWAQMEGLEKHYLLTGDEASRAAVVRVAEVFLGYLPEYYTPSGGDLRIMARFIHGALLAWRLTPGGDTPAGTAVRDWAARIDFLVEKARVWQQADGGYPAAITCNTTMNYQVALLHDALIKVHAYYRADAALVSQVKRGADFLWSTQWVPAAMAFQYLSGGCTNVGGTETASDLNGLFASTFGWVYQKTGDTRYRDAAEQVFSGTVRGWYLVGSKQFNQAFTTSFHHLSTR